MAWKSKRTRNRGAGVISGLVVGVTSIAICGSVLSQQPERGGRISIATSSAPTSLVNQVDTGANTFSLGSRYHEPLVHLNADGTFGPRLAASWQESADGLTWTFKLRRGVKWHDGVPFVAADVKWNMETVWKQTWSNPSLDAIHAVEVPDTETVVFRVKHRVSSDVLLTTLSQRAYVLPPHGYTAKPLRESEQNQMPIGTGPFRVKEYRRGQFILLERNPDYWDKGKPYVDEIVWRLMPDPGTRAAALEAGELDIVPMSAVPLFDIDRLAKNSKLQVTSDGYAGYRWTQFMQFNMRRPELADVRVRRAIAHAIDRQVIARATYLDRAKPSDSPIPSTSKYHLAGNKSYAYDPKLAERLLDEAGYRRGADGTRFTLTMVSPTILQGVMQRSGQYIRQALKQVGIELNFEMVDTGTYVQRVYRTRQFDIEMFVNVFIVDPCMATTYWYSAAGYRSGLPFRNSSGIEDPALEAAIDKSCTEPDQAKRLVALHEFQRLAQELLPILTLVEEDRVDVVNRRIQNLGKHANWYYDGWADLWIKN
jgi:peptide/nickel transport system substrate-binding protein